MVPSGQSNVVENVVRYSEYVVAMNVAVVTYWRTYDRNHSNEYSPEKPYIAMNIHTNVPTIFFSKYVVAMNILYFKANEA